MEQIYSPKEAAEKLNVTVQTLWAWAKRNKIEYIKVGSRYRFQKSTIDRILTPHNVENESFI
jgi:excisionase family DNA binding protein